MSDAQTEIGRVSSPQVAGLERKIASINGLRGVAILLVILHHLFIPYFIAPASHPIVFGQDTPTAALIRSAWLGVDVFFVLSGFVLYLPYRMGRREMQSRGDAVRFYTHRAQRLMPLYLIVVLVGLVFHAQSSIGGSRWLLELGGLVSTLFVFSPHGFMPPSNIVLWSVGVEIWFSVLFPVFLVVIARWGIWPVVCVTTVASLAFGAVGYSIAIERVGHLLPLTSGLAGKAYEFLFGMLVCDLYVSSQESGRRSRGSDAGIALLAAGACWIAVLILDFRPGSMISRLGTPLFDVAFAVFLLELLRGPRVLSRMFEPWILQLLGAMCYSVYAWHGIVLNVMVPPVSQIDETWRQLPLFLLVTLALSALSYRYIEFGAQRDWRALFLLRASS